MEEAVLRLRHMEGYNTKEDRIRASLWLARRRFEMQELEKIIGPTRQSLSGFMHGKSAGQDLMDKAEAFVRKEGFWVWDAFEPGKADAYQRLDANLRYAVDKLRALTEYLSDPSGDSLDKVLALRSTIADIAQGFNRAVDREDKGPDSP